MVDYEGREEDPESSFVVTADTDKDGDGYVEISEEMDRYVSLDKTRATLVLTAIMLAWPDLCGGEDAHI